MIKPKNFKKALNIPTCIMADDAKLKLMIALVHVNKKMLSQRAKQFLKPWMCTSVTYIKQTYAILFNLSVLY